MSVLVTERRHVVAAVISLVFGVLVIFALGFPQILFFFAVAGLTLGLFAALRSNERRDRVAGWVGVFLSGLPLLILVVRVFIRG